MEENWLRDAFLAYTIGKEHLQHRKSSFLLLSLLHGGILHLSQVVGRWFGAYFTSKLEEIILMLEGFSMKIKKE